MTTIQGNRPGGSQVASFPVFSAEYDPRHPIPFLKTCHRAGVDELAAATAWEKLSSGYSETHRHYHNLAHLDRMLSRMDRVAPENDAMELAIWFHDAIYDPLARDNEARSADLFINCLGTIVSPYLAQKVAQLILATDPKRPRSGEDDENLLIDIDLSILGSSPEEYDQYRTDIRKEYAIVPEPDFNRGRISVLENFLRYPIFVREEFTDLEAQARMNIEREIELLRF